MHKKYKKIGYTYMNEEAFYNQELPRKYDVVSYTDKVGDVAVLRNDGKIYVKTKNGVKKAAVALKGESYMSANKWKDFMAGTGNPGSHGFIAQSWVLPKVLQSAWESHWQLIKDVRDHRTSRRRYDYYDVPFRVRHNYRVACDFSAQLQRWFTELHDRPLDAEMVSGFVGYGGHIPEFYDTKILHKGPEVVSHQASLPVRIDLNQYSALTYNNKNITLGRGWLRGNEYRGKVPLFPYKDGTLNKPKGIILQGVKRNGYVRACIFWVVGTTLSMGDDVVPHNHTDRYYINLGSYMINVCKLSEDLEVFDVDVLGSVGFA